MKKLLNLSKKIYINTVKISIKKNIKISKNKILFFFFLLNKKTVASILIPPLFYIKTLVKQAFLTMYSPSAHNPTYSNQLPKTCPNSSALCPCLFAYQTKLHVLL